MNANGSAIPMFDYVEQYDSMQEEILEAIRGVLASGRLILGPRVRQFEENFARYLGGGHAVGVGNGTDALAIALRAVGVGPGDEVITVANTALPTITAIRMAGARPVFCEIDPTTLLMDPRDAEARITNRTRAILPVHLYGNAVDMPALCEIAARRQLAIVEDCAQACGTTIDGRHVGTFGDVGAFSFYPTKNLGAYGDGGLCVTRDAELAATIRQIRDNGRGNDGTCVVEGVNSRLDELQAAILDCKLARLPDFLAARRRLADIYQECLPAWIEVPEVDDRVLHSYHLFVIRSARRAELARRLRNEAIGYGIHYPTPIHRMPAYRFLNYHEGSLPLTEQAAAEVLSLPCYPELPHESVRRICAVIHEECLARN